MHNGQEPKKQPGFSVKSCLAPGEKLTRESLGRVASGPESQCSRVAKGMLKTMAMGPQKPAK